MTGASMAAGVSGHVRRILVIAGHAFTQLVRMKVFGFLAVFAVLVIASNFLDLPQHESPESVGAGVLRSIRSWSLGAMTLFSVVLAVSATALLLPRDMEDRTLYTILAKPVPRIDYLAGKLLGVLALVFVSLLIMDLLMSAVLWIRTGMVLAEQRAMVTALGWPADAAESLYADTRAAGPVWSLHCAVFAVFLRAAVMAALALLVSTFSSSTLFTTIVGFLVYFIGHFQADAREFFLQAGEAGQGPAARVLALLVSLVFPDFRMFQCIDAVIEGLPLPAGILGGLVLFSGFHILVFLGLAWFVFSDKEF
jgi:ABC-2 type transport system permease protein